MQPPRNRKGGDWEPSTSPLARPSSIPTPEETGSKRLGWTYGAPRQSSTLQAEPTEQRRQSSTLPIGMELFEITFFRRSEN